MADEVKCFVIVSPTKGVYIGGRMWGSNCGAKSAPVFSAEDPEKLKLVQQQCPQAAFREVPAEAVTGGFLDKKAEGLGFAWAGSDEKKADPENKPETPETEPKVQEAVGGELGVEESHSKRKGRNRS